MIRPSIIRCWATALCAAALLSTAAHARGPAPADIAVSEIPAEGRDVLVRIKAGGPFRYERDGVVFGNREHRLPERKRGYYHEYTVPTPGAKNRGARRIVCGGAKTAPEACYYTGDHYETFARIRE
jgi:ribonuclease T1